MIAMHFSRSSPSVEPLFSRNTNTATAALPLIPRRSASRSRSAPPSPQTFSLVSTPTPVKVIIQQSTPPHEPPQLSVPYSQLTDSESSSSSSISDGTRPTIVIKGRHPGAARSMVCPPEQSTPTPAVHNARILEEHRRLEKYAEDRREDATPRPSMRPLLYNPGIPLRLQTEGLKARNFSETHVRASTESPAPVSLAPTSSSQPPLVRKKSGQLVKSSLKTSKSLSVITTAVSSKSEPATPTHAKVVHFDAQLEHVKLFLAEQKPLAVSRDGSPTEDTSGTDSDFPSFIFGDSDDRHPRKTLVMRLLNMPVLDENSDVALEELVLSLEGTSIIGRVRVRNIAFAKWLTVRFTFDSWQTTSEVTGKWVESIDCDFDRFYFSIRLNDLLARIEGKRLYLAVKYAVGGKELWDNNAGQNYLASFTKVASMPKDDGCMAKGDIARLKSKLENVAGGKEANGSSLSSQSFSRSAITAPRFNFKIDPDESCTPPSKPPPLPRLRTQTHPTIPTPNSVPWPAKSRMRDIPVTKTSTQLGSPRDADEETLFSAACLPSDTQDETSPVRNHRRGYFPDMSAMDSDGSTVKKMIPGTPYAPSRLDQTPRPAPRFHSFPPREGFRSAPPYGLGFSSSVYLDQGDGSDLSTPSFTSPTSSSPPSTASSPSESFLEYALIAGLKRDVSASPGTNYRHFINKFCFFTGSDKTAYLNVPQDPIPRTQSASDIEELLSSTSPKLHPSDSFYPATPSRSPSFDDINIGVRSGSSTPTAHGMCASHVAVPSSPTILLDSRPAMPIVA